MNHLSLEPCWPQIVDLFNVKLVLTSFEWKEAPILLLDTQRKHYLFKNCTYEDHILFHYVYDWLWYLRKHEKVTILSVYQIEIQLVKRNSYASPWVAWKTLAGKVFQDLNFSLDIQIKLQFWKSIEIVFHDSN